MRPQLKSALIALSIVLTPVSLGLAALAQAPLQPVAYLALVKRPPETPTPIPTATPTNTPTATATATLPPGVTPTLTPIGDLCQLDPNPASALNFPVIIDDIDKEGEIVALKNVSGTTIDLAGWHMCSINGNQEHTGLNGMLAPGQIRNFPYAGGGNIWNDSQRDDGALYNPAGQLIAYDVNID